MAPILRSWLALVTLALVAPSVFAQTPGLEEKAGPAAEPRKLSRRDLDRREALELFALGQVQERDGRLVEAIRTYEQAARLDPESARIRKSLSALYLAVDRLDAAIKVCREALDLEPDDPETWFNYARQLKVQDRQADAVAAMENGLKCESLKEKAALHVQMLFDLGTMNEARGNFAGAVDALAKCGELLDNPEPIVEQGTASKEDVIAQAAETWERLGRVAVRAKQFDAAIKAYHKAQEKDPTRRKRLSYNLADVYAGQEKWTEALASVDDYLTTRPEGPEAYEFKATILEKLGRDKEVLSALEAYAANDEENPALQLLLARYYARAGKTQEAERVYRPLTEKSPSPDVYRGLFALYRNQANGGERILAVLDTAIEGATETKDRPGNTGDAARARAMLVVLRDDPAAFKVMLPAISRRLQGTGQMQYETRHFLAVVAARTHHLAEAEKLYRSCLDDSTGRRQEPELYAGLLRVLKLAHKYEAVVEVCKKGLDVAQQTNRVIFHLDMAWALGRLGKVEEAIKQADAGVEIASDTDRINARRARVGVLLDAGRVEKALADCEDMLKEFTKSDEVLEVRYLLSGVYSAAKNYDKATEQLKMIIEAQPDSAVAYNDLGYLWADQGKNLEEAEKLIRRALELDRKQKTAGLKVMADAEEDNAAYVDSLGWVLFRRGRYDEARKELERASGMFGGNDDPVVWDHLGDVYQRLSETKRARGAWLKAVELYDKGYRAPDERVKDIKKKLQMLAAPVGN